MKHLSTVGRFFTPVAMVVFLTHEISQSMNVTGAWVYFVVIGSAFSAIGIEVIGILSGHTLEGFWRIGDKTRASLAFLLLLVYTSASIYIMRHNATLIIVPVIAAVLYVVAALADSLGVQVETAVSESAAAGEVEAARLAWEREQDAADREMERKQKIADMRLKHELKLAKLSQTPKSTITTRANHQRTISEPSAKFYECACGKVYENSRAYNGHKRHCKAEDVKVSSNGHIKEVAK